MRKDLRLAAAAADPRHRVLTEALLGLFDQACQAGLGEEDFASVVKVASLST
jgi:3-hydroxyisobutyrate dehydrogenase-like beta-hydroxyacid dehydrogenase